MWPNEIFEGWTARVFEIWAREAHERGNVPTYYPGGTKSGRKAERTPDGRYVDPPWQVRAVEDAVIAQERADIAAGQKVQQLEDAFRTVSAWIVRLPRRVVEGVLGWPAWVIPVGAVALAIFLARQWGTRR